MNELEDSPRRFTLFAALRAIERANPAQPRMGETRRTVQDPVRVVQPASLSFAASDVVAFDPRARPVAHLEQQSFGLLGPNGPLPLHLTEYCFERQHQHADPTLHEFLTALQHRITTLFYRAWAESDPATSLDRPDADRFGQQVGALLGFSGPRAQDCDAAPNGIRLATAGTRAPQVRTAEGLRVLLEAYFEIPFEIRPFIPEWLPIPSECRTRLGVPGSGASLGLGATLGEASWQCQHKFEIVAGPLSRAEFAALLPGTRGLDELAALVTYHTNDEWSWQLRLRLKEPDMAGMRLGSGAQLGWTTWIGSRRGTGDDVVLQGDVYG